MQHGFGSFAASARSGGDLPSILQALQSGHIGTARPSYVEDGMVWHKHRPSEGLAGTIEKYFTFGGVDHLEGAFDLSSGKYSGAGGGGAGIFTATEGSGEFKAPTSGRLFLCLFGAGGGGGLNRDALGRASGGGAGGSAFLTVNILKGEKIAWIAGAGVALRVGDANGATGGTSSCSAALASGSFSMSATGGEGGSRGDGSGSSVGGSGGIGIGGDLNLTGGVGGTAVATINNAAASSGGCALLFPGLTAADGDAPSVTNGQGVRPSYNLLSENLTTGGPPFVEILNTSSNISITVSNAGSFGAGSGGAVSYNQNGAYSLESDLGGPGGMTTAFFPDDILSLLEL